MQFTVIARTLKSALIVNQIRWNEFDIVILEPFKFELIHLIQDQVLCPRDETVDIRDLKSRA